MAINALKSPDSSRFFQAEASSTNASSHSSPFPEPVPDGLAIRLAHILREIIGQGRRKQRDLRQPERRKRGSGEHPVSVKVEKSPGAGLEHRDEQGPQQIGTHQQQGPVRGRGEIVRRGGMHPEVGVRSERQVEPHHPVHVQEHHGRQRAEDAGDFRLRM
jgi:hypothetical protein